MTRVIAARSGLYGGLFVAFLILSATCRAASLSADDRKLLEGLVNELIIDPQGGRRVKIKAPVRTVWGHAEEVEREGWLKTDATDGKVSRIYFTAGDSVAAPADPKAILDIDFLGMCRKRYGPPTAEQEAVEEGTSKGKDQEFHATFARMGMDALGLFEDSDLVYAAWLHRLGQDDLAAAALTRVHARRPDGQRGGGDNAKADPVADLRDALAWYNFAGMIHAYMIRADEDALQYGRRLLRLKPKDEDRTYSQADAIVADLVRRLKKGSFGKTPHALDKPPAGYDTWDAAKRVAYWIDQLDEVDARQQGQPGGVDLADDPRVAALIKIGDTAVPALIDAIEKDQRLTRSVHFWRDFARSRTVLGVREAALTAAMSILGVRVFEPASTGDNFTARGDDGVKQTVANLRAYWKKYGSKPFEERMMNVLTDPNARFEAVREAAINLASFGEERTLGTTVWSGAWRRGVDAPPPALDPAIERIKNPTAAQAILAAMDRDLAHHDGTQKGDQLYDYRRRQIAGQYLGALIKLGDKRIAATLAERAGVAERAGDARMRRQWASAAHALGEAAPLARFADDFTAGRIELPKNDKPLTNDNDQPGRVELADIVANLAAAASNLPAADRALYALAEPTHPLYAEVAQRVLSDSRSSSEGPWLAHPFCIAIIRRELDDMTLTGRRFWISDDGKTLEYKEDRSSGSSGLPEFLADPAARVATADERLCDRAATLANAVFGVPATHPLLKENDARLAQIRNLIDRFGRRFRMLNRAERDALQVPFWEAHFIPDIKPLGRPATDADVNEGRAIFALPQGKGALASGVKLPATCKRKDAKAGSGGLFGRPDVRLLIVQAETDADGKLMYGVLGPRGLQAIPADEVIEITEISAKVAE